MLSLDGESVRSGFAEGADEVGSVDGEALGFG